MLVARSFRYQTRQPAKNANEKSSAVKDGRQKKDDGVRSFGWRPPSFEKYVQDVDASKIVAKPAREKKDVATTMVTVGADGTPIPTNIATSEPSPILKHSDPVAVPSKKKQHTARRSSRSSMRSTDETHDPKSPSPSVAALLAMTAIPKKKRFPRQNDRRVMHRSMSSSDLVEEWRQMDAEEDKLGMSPTMDVLLSPPDHPSILHGGFSYEESNGQNLTAKSASSESMPSLLRGSDLDDSSTYTWSSPPTPEIQGRRATRNRKEKGAVSLSSAECALDDHPLLGMAGTDEDENEHLQFPMESPPQQRPAFKPNKSYNSRPTTFKSNLTASLAALRTAARSFSNFAVPSTLPDDHITRGLFGSPPYASEMRPKAFEGSPTPELRRYLNPLPPKHHLPPTDFHLHGSHLDHTDLEAAAAASASLPREAAKVIALDTYYLHPPVPTADGDSEIDAQTSPAVTEAGRMLPQRHREPRENGEFLRVLVLELNMRRSGKLEDGLGRARFWLPPRAEERIPKGAVDDEALRSREERGDNTRRVVRHVPKRWRGVCVEEV